MIFIEPTINYVRTWAVTLLLTVSRALIPHRFLSVILGHGNSGYRLLSQDTTSGLSSLQDRNLTDMA